MSTMRTLQDLNLCDDYLFYEVMTDAEIAKEFLENVLNKKIRKIKYTEGEKTIKGGYQGKTVRLDLYLEDDENTVYSVEMQNENEGNLPKRARKYGAQIDYKMLKAGEDYATLKQQIVIFICTFDLFKCGHYKYTFSNLCHEVKGLEFGDGTTKILLNTRGIHGEISHGLKAFLRFVENSTPENAEALGDDFVSRVSKRVSAVKNDEERQAEFMTFEELIERECRKTERLVREQARKDIEAEKDLEYAKKMRAEGLPIETIARMTGLSPAEIEKLK